MFVFFLYIFTILSFQQSRSHNSKLSPESENITSQCTHLSSFRRKIFSRPRAFYIVSALLSYLRPLEVREDASDTKMD